MKAGAVKMQLNSANKMTYHRLPFQYLCQGEVLRKKSLSGSQAHFCVRVTGKIAKSL